MPRLFLPFFALFVLLLASCSRPTVWNSENSLEETSPPSFNGESADAAGLTRAIEQSLTYLNKIAPEVMLRFGEDLYPVSLVRGSLEDFKGKLNELGFTEPFFAYLRENFKFYKSRADPVLFTGYYEASLRGSLAPSERYQFPLYRTPDDLVRVDLAKFFKEKKVEGLPSSLFGRLTEERRVEPYYSRDEIDHEGKLAGKNLEIAWVDDPIALFFLHIQGSGVIELDDGSSLQISYANSNGNQYRAIGSLLLKEGTLDSSNVSMQAIRAYLATRPDRLREIFAYNPSYVFFRTVKEGPVGSIGVPLTPLRSIATDSSLFPKGALAFVVTEQPTFNAEHVRTGGSPFSRFMLNQDTGGAIKGAGRVDIFTGKGSESELLAGHFKEEGQLYFLIKKSPS